MTENMNPVHCNNENVEQYEHNIELHLSTVEVSLTGTLKTGLSLFNDGKFWIITDHSVTEYSI